MFYFHYKRSDRKTSCNIDPQAVIARLAPYAPPDKSGFLARDEKSLLIQCVNWNTPQSRFEPAPFFHAASQTEAAAWARLDNRQELAAKLAVSTPDLALKSDTELIALSYLRWGEDCVDHLIGDFVFVVHDRKHQKVFCGRDHLGVRPFYYYLSNDVFACATSLAALLGLEDVPIRIRQQWVAEYLLHLSMSFEDTPYEGVQKLPPAHGLTIDGKQTQRRKYFQLSAEPELQLKDSREYVEAYRDALEEAVRCRLASDYDIGAELSGGVDSSTVTAFAAKCLGKNLSRLHTFGFAFSQYEPRYIQSVIDYCRLPDNHMIQQGVIDRRERLQRSLRLLGYPVEHANATHHEPFYRLAENLNIRPLMSGFGGDEFGTTIHGYLIPMDMIVRGRYREVFDILQGNAFYRFLRLVKLEWRRRKTRNFRKQDFNPRFYQAFAERWPQRIIRDNLVDLYGLKTRYFDMARFDAGYTDLKRFTLEKRWMPFVPTRMENCTLMAAGRKIEYSWPLLDVRLVKLFLSIPSQENFYRGMGRYLHRRAADGIVPSLVNWKQSKYMGPINQNGWRDAEGGQPDLSDSHPVLKEYVDLEKLSRQIKELKALQQAGRDDARTFSFTRNISAVQQIDAWLKYLDSRP